MFTFLKNSIMKLFCLTNHKDIGTLYLFFGLLLLGTILILFLMLRFEWFFFDLLLFFNIEFENYLVFVSFSLIGFLLIASCLFFLPSFWFKFFLKTIVIFFILYFFGLTILVEALKLLQIILVFFQFTVVVIVPIFLKITGFLLHVFLSYALYILSYALSILSYLLRLLPLESIYYSVFIEQLDLVDFILFSVGFWCVYTKKIIVFKIKSEAPLDTGCSEWEEEFFISFIGQRVLDLAVILIGLALINNGVSFLTAYGLLYFSYFWFGLNVKILKKLEEYDKKRMSNEL